MARRKWRVHVIGELGCCGHIQTEVDRAMMYISTLSTPMVDVWLTSGGAIRHVWVPHLGAT